MRKLESFLKEKLQKGEKSFTSKEIEETLDFNKNNCKQALFRLRKKKEIVSPFKGFYIILSVEDQVLGSLPPGDLMPVLFKHLKLDYYVALLSAGLYNGASHQKPNKFQVITTKQFKNNILKLGHLYIQLIYKKSIAGLPLKEKVVDTGILKIATPELLAMDLFLYRRQSGGLDHIATVLSELIEEIHLAKFKSFCKKSKQNFWMQRMGYILDSIDPMNEEKKEKIMMILEEVLKTRKVKYIPLQPSLPHKGHEKNTRWKIIANTTVESDT